MAERRRIDGLARWVARIERVVPRVAVVAAAVGLVLLFETKRDELAGLEWRLSWQTAAAGAAAFALAPLVQGLSFWLSLRMLTGTTPAADAMVVWSRSYVVRYAPTGALSLAYRVASRRRLHASAEQVLAAYAYEHVATLAAGAAACLVLFALAASLPPLPVLAIAAAALAATAALCPGIAGRAAEALARRVGIRVSAILPGRQVAALVALNGVGWLGTGTGVYLVVGALTADAPGFLWLVGSYTAGYLVGFVTPLAPGGIGVRETMLFVLLRTRYEKPTALGASLAIRVVNVAGELLAVALVHCAYVVLLATRRARLAPAASPA